MPPLDRIPLRDFVFALVALFAAALVLAVFSESPEVGGEVLIVAAAVAAVWVWLWRRGEF